MRMSKKTKVHLLRIFSVYLGFFFFYVYSIMDKYKAFAFTVRPGTGMPPELRQGLVRWMKLQTSAFAVAEMRGTEAEHIHGQIFCENAREIGKINVALNRICEKHIETWSQANKTVLNQGTRIAYNDNFIKEYLLNNEDKEEEVDIVINHINFPEGKGARDYYPS